VLSKKEIPCKDKDGETKETSAPGVRLQSVVQENEKQVQVCSGTLTWARQSVYLALFLKALRGQVQDLLQLCVGALHEVLQTSPMRCQRGRNVRRKIPPNTRFHRGRLTSVPSSTHSPELYLRPVSLKFISRGILFLLTPSLLQKSICNCFREIHCFFTPCIRSVSEWPKTTALCRSRSNSPPRPEVGSH